MIYKDYTPNGGEECCKRCLFLKFGHIALSWSPSLYKEVLTCRPLFFFQGIFSGVLVSTFVVCKVCLHPNFELTSGTPLKRYPTLGHMVPEFPCLWFSFFLFPQIEAPLERLANLWTCLTCWYLLGIGGYFHAVLPTKCTPSKFWSGLSALCICLDYIRGSCYILLSQIETIIRSYCKVDRCFWCLGPSRNLFISITCLGQVVNTTFVGATPGKATWGLSPTGVWNASIAGGMGTSSEKDGSREDRCFFVMKLYALLVCSTRSRNV